MQITLIRKWKVYQYRVDHHTQTLKNTLFNCTVINLVMKIQPFKSNEHLRADDPCTEQSTMFFHFWLLKCIIVYKIQNLNTRTLRETIYIRGKLLSVFLYFLFFIYSFFHDSTSIFLAWKSCPRLAREFRSSRHQGINIITIHHRFYGALYCSQIASFTAKVKRK